MHDSLLARPCPSDSPREPDVQTRQVHDCLLMNCDVSSYLSKKNAAFTPVGLTPLSRDERRQRNKVRNSRAALASTTSNLSDIIPEYHENTAENVSAESTAGNAATADESSDHVAVAVAAVESDETLTRSTTIERVRSMQRNTLNWLHAEEGQADAAGSMGDGSNSDEVGQAEEPKPDSGLPVSMRI